MTVTMEYLLQLIGEQQVELTLLRREVARLMPPAEPALVAPAPPPRAADRARAPLAMAARPEAAAPQPEEVADDAPRR